jgi:predicted nucleic-acid-binding Zn-ribbon protein
VCMMLNDGDSQVTIRHVHTKYIITVNNNIFMNKVVLACFYSSLFKKYDASFKWEAYMRLDEMKCS